MKMYAPRLKKKACYRTWSNGSLDWADNKNPQGVIDSESGAITTMEVIFSCMS